MDDVDYNAQCPSDKETCVSVTIKSENSATSVDLSDGHVNTDVSETNPIASSLNDMPTVSSDDGQNSKENLSRGSLCTFPVTDEDPHCEIENQKTVPAPVNTATTTVNNRTSYSCKEILPARSNSGEDPNDTNIDVPTSTTPTLSVKQERDEQDEAYRVQPQTEMPADADRHLKLKFHRNLSAVSRSLRYDRANSEHRDADLPKLGGERVATTSGGKDSFHSSAPVLHSIKECHMKLVPFATSELPNLSCDSAVPRGDAKTRLKEEPIETFDPVHSAVQDSSPSNAPCAEDDELSANDEIARKCELVPSSAPVERPHSCRHCSKKFLNKSICTLHEASHTTTDQRRIDKDPSQCSERKTGKRYPCPSCNKKFAQKVNLAKHECDSSTYPCSYCEKVFRFKSKWATHEKVHTREKRYACAHCDKTFAQRFTCAAHERIHTGEKPFTCSYCSKGFAWKSVLVKHERIHTEEKPYSCSYCDKTFKQRTHCVDHESIHTGDKRFSCSYCGKSFLRSFNCRTHERTHTGDKPYSCSHCGKTFAHKCSCKLHEKTHTGERPFRCSFCSRSFKVVLECRLHEKVHTGEKNYSCRYCDKRFTRSSSRNMHERIHTGEGVFLCIHCNKKFRQKSVYTAHLETHSVRKLSILNGVMNSYDMLEPSQM